MGIAKEEIRNLIKKILSPVIFEIGCADGYDTLEFIKMFDDLNFKMYCFEPDPRNIEEFKKNVIDNRVTLIECAIGDFNGKGKFYQSSISYPHSSSLKKPILTTINKEWPDMKFENSFDVNVITLDNFIKENNIEKIDFIWADTQGSDDLMLNGAKQSLNNKINYIYTEYNKTKYYENEPSMENIIGILGNDWEIIRKYKADILIQNKNYK